MVKVVRLEGVLPSGHDRKSLGIANAGTVFGHTLNVYSTEQHGFFAILQFRGHDAWARFFASSMKDDLRYTPTDCFETFPFPSGWEANAELERVGREYYEYRTELMVERGEGQVCARERWAGGEEEAGVQKK